jgi:DNA-binding Lrp family transcriptional regulator
MPVCTRGGGGMTTCDSTDLALLELLQDEVPLVPRPYEAVGRQLGISEDEVLARLARLLDAGVVRGISPVLEAGAVGNKASTLVALRVPEDRVKEIVPIINGYREVSHNFRRENTYPVWFTVSAHDREQVEGILAGILGRAGISGDDVLELPTVRKFKVDVRFRLTGRADGRK